VGLRVDLPHHALAEIGDQYALGRLLYSNPIRCGLDPTTGKWVESWPFGAKTNSSPYPPSAPSLLKP
jgi:hypothetical protein